MIRSTPGAAVLTTTVALLLLSPAAFAQTNDAHFGGANGSNAAGSYFFAATTDARFIASLVWNLKVAGGTPNAFDGASTLYDLDLSVIDVTAGNALLGSSASTIDNTENLWVNIMGGHSYELLVTHKGADFDWDYGLAWQAGPVPEPCSLGLLGAVALLVLRRRM